MENRNTLTYKRKLVLVCRLTRRFMPMLILTSVLTNVLVYKWGMIGIQPAFMIKGVLSGAIYYLIYERNRRNETIFYYINLGFSRKKLALWLILMDLFFFVLLLILTLCVR